MYFLQENNYWAKIFAKQEVAIQLESSNFVLLDTKESWVKLPWIVYQTWQQYVSEWFAYATTS